MDNSGLASRKYARIIQKLGFDAKFSEFKIQDIVGGRGFVWRGLCTPE